MKSLSAKMLHIEYSASSSTRLARLVPASDQFHISAIAKMIYIIYVT